MEGITGVFKSRQEADRTIQELLDLGLPNKRIGLLVPGSDPRQIERAVLTVDTEEPGMGKAMGAAVGGAMGAAGGATVGLAAATLAIPGSDEGVGSWPAPRPRCSRSRDDAARPRL